MNVHIAFATAALLAGAITSADAATATINLTLDASFIANTGNGFTGNVQGAPAFAPPVIFSLAEGDTLDYTVQFLPGQSLTLVNPTQLWSFIFADVASDVTGTGTLALLNSSGAALFTSLSKTDTEGAVHFGQFFDAGDFIGLPGTITFSGLHYVGTVVDYVEPGITTRIYADPGFSFQADSFVTSVPEPQGWALMLAGLCGVVAVRQLRRPRDQSNLTAA